LTRRRLPVTRDSITHRVAITDNGGNIFDLYIIVGLYTQSKRDKGKRRPGEMFLNIGKVGSTLRGMLDVLGIQTSLLLQNGVSLESICGKMEGVSFEPNGSTDNPEIPTCSSLIDYVFHWLRNTFNEHPQSR